MNAITVYCAASNDLEEHFHTDAEVLGRALGVRGLDLVYGGGRVGLMGEIARAARLHGSRTIGIITEYLNGRELGDDDCTELVVVDSMQRRKRLMADRGQAFIMMPGGIGTLEEFFETLVARQLEEHAKPIGILNTSGYFDPLIVLLEHGVDHRFIRPEVLELMVVDTGPEKLLDHLVEVATVHGW